MNWEVNRGSRSVMTLDGTPNRGKTWWKYSNATPSASIDSLQERNMAIFVHPWSVIVRIESYPWDLGNLTIKSIAMVENGGMFGCGKIGERGAFSLWVLTLFL